MDKKNSKRKASNNDRPQEEPKKKKNLKETPIGITDNASPIIPVPSTSGLSRSELELAVSTQTKELQSYVVSEERKQIWWVVQYAEGGKCGVINEGTDVVGMDRSEDEPLNPTVGLLVDVIVAQNKSSGRRYRATLLKGPFNTKKGAKASLALCSKPLTAVELPRSCASCQQLQIQLQQQTGLSDSLRKFSCCNFNTCCGPYMIA